MSYIFTQEREVLEMLAGRRSSPISMPAISAAARKA
jgi:hypothetical protein